MKKLTKKKRIVLSSAAVVLTGATIISALAIGANALSYYSFEYVEKLKGQYSQEPMQILEIAPSESQSIFGYLVEGSEPIRDWKTVASMYNVKSVRQNYVQSAFDSLIDAGIMSSQKDAAPLQMISSYQECYPWEAKDYPSLTEIMELQYEETASYTGKMVKATGENGGAYNADFKYTLENESYVSVFSFKDFKNNIINTCKLNPLDYASGIKNKASKIFAIDTSEKAIAVFGSTQQNWENNVGYSNYFDLASAYKSPSYYSIDVEAGKTYCLSFDAIVNNGRGQVSIIPLDDSGKVVYYSPNYSNQYWLISEYFDTTVDGTPATFRFTIPKSTNIKKIQVRFDLSGVETSARLRNVNIYEFNKNSFSMKDYKAPSAVTNAKNISVTASGNSQILNSFPESGKNDYYSYINCDPASLYTLTYHVESNGGKNGVQIYGFDKDYKLVKKYVEDSKIFGTGSGTKNVNFTTDSNVVYLGVAFASESSTSKKAVQAYSNVSLTTYKDYVSVGRATHVQEYDHFSTGRPQETLSINNIFDYEKWSVSGSKSVKFSNKQGLVTAYDNGIITIKGGNFETQSTNYSGEGFIASEKLYYMAVNDGSSYRICFRPTFENDDDKITYTVHYSDSAKKKLGSKTVTVSKADIDEEGLYSSFFAPVAGTEYIEISFGITEANQKASFDYISINELYKPESYFYNLIFTKINAKDLTEADRGTDLYTMTDFVEVGSVGTFERDPLRRYYILDEFSQKYVEAPENVSDGVMLYLPGPYYVWAGNYGDEDFYVNESVEYFKAKINDEGYIKATSSNISAGSVLYTKSGDKYTLVGVYSNETDLNANDYYIAATPVSDSFDSVHPYYLEANSFREAEEGERAYFVSDLNSYVYVGTGGEYDIADGDEDLMIQTSTVFYKGGFKNNNWFKRYVLDCKGDNDKELQAALDSVQVKVITYTPDYLNNLEYSDDEKVTELGNSLTNFELCVFSNGIDLSKNKPAEYPTDFSDDVEKVLEKRLLSQEESDYEFMPIIIDTELLGNSKANIKKLAQAICSVKNDEGSTDISSDSGINDYIFRFKKNDFGAGTKYIINTRFIKDVLGYTESTIERDYSDKSHKYNKVWEAIQYENALRDARNKYKPLEKILSEAAIIRHILNFRGQRSINNKSVINILEIEPRSNLSVLYSKNSEKSETKIIDVRRWFASDVEAFDKASDNDKNVKYTYYDKNGKAKTGTTTFKITTMAPQELTGKIEDLAETYDLVYVGTSLDGFTGKKNIVNENGNVLETVPDYNDGNMDGMFYTSTGDIFESSGDGALKRSEIGGMMYDDYQTLNVFGKEAWFVDNSSVSFRESGNDITDSKMEELEIFMQQGLPVVIGDNICLQDYCGELKVKVQGMTYYQRKGRKVYLPGHEGDSTYSFEASDNKVHVCLTAQVVGELPEGTITSFQWYYVGSDGASHPINQENTETLSFAWFRKLIGQPYEEQVANKDYVSIDSDGDGVNDLFVLDFEPRKYTEDGDYYCEVKYDFSNCKNTLGATLRYNGLYGETVTHNAQSNKIHVFKENRKYTVVYFDHKTNTDWVDAFAPVFSKAGFDIKKQYGLCCAVTPIPEDANDFIGYRFNKAKYNVSVTVSDWVYRWGSYDGFNEDGVNGGFTNSESTYVIRPNDYGFNLPFEIGIYAPGDDEYKVACCSTFTNSETFAGSDQRNTVGGHGNWDFPIGGFNGCGSSREFKVSGYKLYLKDANGTRVTQAEGYKDTEGGYSISGRDTNGNDICGNPVEINERAAIFSDRIDNCSNIYDALSNISSLRNVMTQNQVERKDGTYRELLNMFVNLSEPEIEFVSGEEPISFPNALENDTLQFSFRVINETEIDTINAKYNCEIFVDENGDGQYVKSERIDATITGDTDNGVGGLKTSSDANGQHVYSVSFKFGQKNAGIKPWRMKITKIGEEGAHTSYTDYAYIEPEIPKELTALQVLAGDMDPDYMYLDNGGTAERAENSIKSSSYKRYKGEKDNPYHGNQFKGSVFLSDIYISDELININQNTDYDTGRTLSRTIYYKEADGTVFPGTKNEEYIYNNSRTVDHVEFVVGKDYIVKIYFTCVEEINKNITLNPEMLDNYDILLLGYGDSYGKMGLGKTQSALDIAETVGLNQNASLAIENKIADGNPVLFCHDTINYNVNFVNYWANDVLSFGNDVVNELGNFWNKVTSVFDAIGSWITGGGFEIDKSDWDKYNSDIHTSRIKNGYYANLILRDPLNQDAYGISARIKERSGFSYDDDGLHRGHRYNTIYYDGATGDESKGIQDVGPLWYYDESGKETQAEDYYVWKKIYRSLKTDKERADFAALNNSKGQGSIVAYNCLMMEERGYIIAWVPGSNGTKVDNFVHGFTSYTAHRFSKGAASPTYTNKVSQVNEGQITTYPYYINVEDMYSKEKGTQNIKLTHEQYFTANLQENAAGENATVWYCLAPGTGEYKNSYSSIRNDCENAYYVYTKGNVTYTGAGHTNGFTAFEAKLFFNAIIAAGRTEGKRPSVTFHAANNDPESLEYIAFVATTDSGASAEDEYYNKNGKVIWKEPVYFKVNNATESLANDETREVKFYMDDPANAENRIDITGNVVVKNTEGTTVEKDKIVPGLYYMMDIPDTVFDSMFTGAEGEKLLSAANTKIYVEVVLSEEEEKMTVEDAVIDIDSWKDSAFFRVGDSMDANHEVKFYMVDRVNGNEEIDISENVTIKDMSGNVVNRSDIVKDNDYEIIVPDNLLSTMKANEIGQTYIYVEVVSKNASAGAEPDERYSIYYMFGDEAAIKKESEIAQLEISLTGLFDLR